MKFVLNFKILIRLNCSLTSQIQIFTKQLYKQLNSLSWNWIKYRYVYIQLYLNVPPPDIPPNLLITTNLLCRLQNFFSCIKPLFHQLYHHPQCIFYVQIRLLHREKWIEYCHQNSINQWQSRSHHNMLVDTDTRLYGTGVTSGDSHETAIYSFV